MFVKRKVLGTALAGVLALSLTPSLSAAPATAAPSPLAGAVAAPASQDIADRIKALPGVSNVVEQAAPTGYRFFTMTFRQPVDHKDPKKGTFEQRITLLHKDVSRPMVMYTGGYNVSTNPSRSEPTQIVDGNQLSMEYRFFEPSRPADPDWTKQLTIWQAATDQHRIIAAFKKIYGAHWLTTGGSKGGMTATYHRRFYPSDVNGTVPYVAPNDVVDSDDVYNAFLDQVGDSQACRDALTGLQRRVLGPDRAWYFDKVRAASDAAGLTYDIVGDFDTAVESAVVDMYFAFWQYSLQSDCASVPDPATATNDEVFDFFSNVSPLDGYADQNVERYVPYYFQAAYQLGSPEPYETRIGDLLQHPGSDVATTFVPADLRPAAFDTKAMPDIDKWVRNKSRQMLYVYGGNDPWGAEAFTCGAGAAARECARYFVAGGNHGSRIAMLPEAERIRATALVLKWAGLGGGDQASRAVAGDGLPQRNAKLDTEPDYLRRVPLG